MALVEMDGGEYGEEQFEEDGLDAAEVDAEIERILKKGKNGMSELDKLNLEQLEILKRDRLHD
jgi:hypothetical protein